MDHAMDRAAPTQSNLTALSQIASQNLTAPSQIPSQNDRTQADDQLNLTAPSTMPSQI